MDKTQLINVNDVYSLFDKSGIARLHVGDIDVIPRVDAVPVVRGRWILRHDGYYCSNCGIGAVYAGVKLNYCPNCGSKMDENVGAI